MRIAGHITLALASNHLLFADLAGLTEGLAENRSIWERALFLLVHPAGAAAPEVMLFKLEKLDLGITTTRPGMTWHFL